MVLDPALLTVRNKWRKADHSAVKSAKFFPRATSRFSLNRGDVGGPGPLLLLLQAVKLSLCSSCSCRRSLMQMDSSRCWHRFQISPRCSSSRPALAATHEDRRRWRWSILVTCGGWGLASKIPKYHHPLSFRHPEV